MTKQYTINFAALLNPPSAPTPLTKFGRISVAGAALSSIAAGVGNLFDFKDAFEWCNEKLCTKTATPVATPWYKKLVGICLECPEGSIKMDDSKSWP